MITPNLGKWLLVFTLVFGFGQVYCQKGEKKNLKNGERLVAFQEYEKAIPYLQNAVALNPNRAQSQYLLGKALFHAERKGHALPYLAKAWEFNPDIGNDINHLYANSLHFLHRFDEAETIYKRALTNFKTGDPEFNLLQLAIQQCSTGKVLIKVPPKSSVQNEVALNSQYADHSPVISGDGKTMVFTSRRPSENRAEGYLDEDLFYSNLENGEWTKPKNIGKAINTASQEASVGLSLDGQSLYLFKNPPAKGDLFESKLKGETWETPVALPSPINSAFFESSISFSPDGKTAYFASDRPGGLGGMDIYTSKLDAAGKWTDAINLGSPINSEWDEDAPILHPNENWFYFSSDRPECIGGYDIFRATHENGKWSNPENLGYPVNTGDDDIYFVITADGRTGYYASAREDSKGGKDIYRVDLETALVIQEQKVERDYEDQELLIKPKLKPDTLIHVPIVKETPKPLNPITLYKGTITDAISGNPIDAKIEVYDIKTEQLLGEYRANLSSGAFAVTLKSGGDYKLLISAENYLSKEERIGIGENQDYQELNKQITLKKVKIGESVVLRNIFFETGKADIKEESTPTLTKLLAFLEEIPSAVVEISGHTDNVGNPEANRVLSEQRAKSVVDYLIAKGIQKERLIAVGYGDVKPIDDNLGEEGRTNNRRTEFKVLRY